MHSSLGILFFIFALLTPDDSFVAKGISSARLLSSRADSIAVVQTASRFHDALTRSSSSSGRAGLPVIVSIPRSKARLIDSNPDSRGARVSHMGSRDVAGAMPLSLSRVKPARTLTVEPFN